MARPVGGDETILVSKQAFLAHEMLFPASNAAVLLAGLVSLAENTAGTFSSAAEFAR